MEKLKVSHILPFNSPAQENDANNNFSEHVGNLLQKELIDGSTLSDKLKKSYWLSYKYRRITLV